MPDETEYTPTTDWVRVMVGYAKTTATDRTLSVKSARAEGVDAEFTPVGDNEGAESND